MAKIPKYKLIFFVNDIFFLNLGFIIYFISSWFDPFLLENLLDLFITIINLGLYLSVTLYFFRYHNLYKINTILSLSSHTVSLLKAANSSLLIFVIIIFLSGSAQSLNTDSFITIFILLAPLFYLVRALLFVKLYKMYAKNHEVNNVLIVGEGNFGKLLAAQRFLENSMALKIVGFVSDDNLEHEGIIPEMKYIGKLKDIKRIISEYSVDEIILSIDSIDYEKMINIIDECNTLNVRLRLSSNLFKILNEKIDVEKYYDIPILEVVSVTSRRNYSKRKRFFDIVLATIAILIFSPVYIISALLIKLTSKGPVIFSQARIGKNGREFTLYKFRSMVIEANEDKQRKEDMLSFMHNQYKGTDSLKVVNKTRLTPFGKFIRKTSIDELPQLFNVLKGDMSLVGPRPCLPYEYENYKSWQKRRLNVLPGCTGLWQILGRNTVSFVDSIVMDVYYTFIQSPLTDIELILRTIPAMIFAKGK